MKKLLCLLAIAFFSGTVITWLVTGASKGWTKTSVEVKKPDEVTGIVGVEYQNRFVAGVDFLGAGVLGSGILAAVSLMFGRKPTKTETK
ncbi:MAG TPA: hypothetical protein VLU94_00460 [Candidatus Nitrosotalea sp.]|nr:hypothetical protein [Candidatus Nitrosotalea sp.]